LKQLTARQKELIKSPKERGKAKEDSSDNYSAIYENASSAFLYIKSIVELLPYFETYRKDFKKANEACNLFSYENLEPFLTGIFPTKKQQGAPVDDRIDFDETKITSEKTGSMIALFKFSSDYLLQAFPQKEYKHLHPRINELIKDLKSMIDTITENQELKRQLVEYSEYVMTFKPRYVEPHTSLFTAECVFCKDTGLGETQDQARNDIKHFPKCKFHQVEDKKSKDTKLRWFRILHPEK